MLVDGGPGDDEKTGGNTPVDFIPSDTFHKQATYEAEDDRLVSGIIRDEAWITNRAKELVLAHNKAAKAPGSDLVEYFPKTAVPVIFEDMWSQKNPEAKGVVDKIYAQAFREFSKTANLDDVYHNRLIDEVAKAKKTIECEAHQHEVVRVKTTTIAMMSCFLAIMVPIATAILPKDLEPLASLVLIPLLIINWKPMREFNKQIKALKEKKISPE